MNGIVFLLEHNWFCNKNYFERLVKTRPFHEDNKNVNSLRNDHSYWDYFHYSYLLYG